MVIFATLTHKRETKFHLKVKVMAQMKEQSKTPERELSDEEIANLSDGEFKALVLKMLTEPVELGRKMK